MSDKKNWTKEQWRDWGKRKQERDARREQMDIDKQKAGQWIIDRYWHEYREKNCN